MTLINNIQIVGSLRVYYEYIMFRAMFSKYYSKDIICGDRTFVFNKGHSIFSFHGFHCKDCNYHIGYSYGPRLSNDEQKMIVKHIQANHFVLFRWNVKSKIIPVKSKVTRIQNVHELKHKHPLKPWKDPESLFCDTEFLKKIIGKDPLNGDECKDA